MRSSAFHQRENTRQASSACSTLIVLTDIRTQCHRLFLRKKLKEFLTEMSVLILRPVLPLRYADTTVRSDCTASSTRLMATLPKGKSGILSKPPHLTNQFNTWGHFRTTAEPQPLQHPGFVELPRLRGALLQEHSDLGPIPKEKFIFSEGLWHCSDLSLTLKELGVNLCGIKLLLKKYIML